MLALVAAWEARREGASLTEALEPFQPGASAPLDAASGARLGTVRAQLERLITELEV